jgi:hypothetical protein
MLGLAPQPLHRLHPRGPIPHLDLLGADAHFHPFADQPRRHRVSVLLHLDGAPLPHLHPTTLHRLQPLRRQATQLGHLLLELLGTLPVPPRHQDAHEFPVLRAAAKVPAATQQQRLLHALLETPVPLLAVSVLVPAVRIRGLGRHSIVTQQRLIPGRVLLRVAVVVHGQRHPIGAI